VSTSVLPHTPALRDELAGSSVIHRERLFAAIRLARTLTIDPPAGAGAVVSFPTVVVVDGQAHDLHTTALPGWFETGDHTVAVQGAAGPYEISGRFEICVGDALPSTPPAWQVKDVETGCFVDVPAEVRVQLPTSIDVPVQPMIGALRRAHLAAERARAELIATNRGLLITVVRRFRGVTRQEAGVIEEGDLMMVAEQQLLEVVERWFTDPVVAPNRAVAFSKLVQRAVGNALRSEIARATGISVEFRNLLSWFHRSPDDRQLHPAEVAYRMAFDAGVTRLMSARNMRSRTEATQQLRQMLELGEASYVAPGRDASEVSRTLRSNGVFVISSRSSIAEIERARSFAGRELLHLDDESKASSNAGLLRDDDDAMERHDVLDAVRSVIAAAGLTELEAAVWVLRTGVVDPTGHMTELPDIASELALSGRAEARAALRRARRKLETLVGNLEQFSNLVLESAR
jgi:hypothetical protein